jgi:hypothetical protein
LNTETTTAYDPIKLSYSVGWGLYKSPYGLAFFKEGDTRRMAQLGALFPPRRRNAGDDKQLERRRHLQAAGRGAAWRNGFPFDWDGYTPYDKLPPL